VIQNGEIADHERYGAFFERVNQFRAMSMNAIEGGELPPVQAGRVQSVDFGGNPARFILRAREFHNGFFDSALA